MARDEFLDALGRLFATRGTTWYGGEAVTQLEHALQAAWEAERAGDPPTVITAALLHDVGHLLHGLGEDCAGRGTDDRHEELGGRFLARYFGPAVTEPVRLHVPAKRYLCATEPGYREGLSPASELSLALQGGPMTAAEADDFCRHPFGPTAARLRRYDDLAKVPGLDTPRFEHFRPYVEACLSATSSAGPA